MNQDRIMATKRLANGLQSNSDTRRLGEFLERFTGEYDVCLTEAIDAELHELLRDLPTDISEKGGCAVFRVLKIIVNFRTGLSIAGL